MYKPDEEGPKTKAPVREVKTRHSQNPSAVPIALGALGSAMYVALMIAWSLAETRELLAMTPNEFGDLLAGVFSPLAFLWLVLGYFQQGQELRASVRALELQGEELRNSVSQQRALVEVSTKQLEAEIEARRIAEEEREYVAQPRFQTSHDLQNFSKSHRSYLFSFENIGTDCSQVKVFCQDDLVSETDHLKAGLGIGFQITVTAEQADDIPGYIEYLDGNGRPRRQRFTIESHRELFGGGLRHGSPRMANEILRPPFEE